MSLSRRSRIILIFWAAVALIAALEAVLTAAWLVRASASDLYTSLRDVPAREVGMVLGAPEFSLGRPSPYLPGRIQAAADLYHAGKVRTLVVSGAIKSDEFYDEQDLHVFT